MSFVAFLRREIWQRQSSTSSSSGNDRRLRNRRSITHLALSRSRKKIPFVCENHCFKNCSFGGYSLPFAVMHRQNVLYSKAEASFNFVSRSIFKYPYEVPLLVTERRHVRLCPGIRTRFGEVQKFSHGFRAIKKIRAADGSQGDLSGEDDDLCPVECVREFYTDDEFFKILDAAKENKSLVVVDFYRTSCGSCKYIEQGFSKLCKKAGDGEAEVIFLKHNVIDEYDEQSEVADRLRIKTVPLFHFYKDGVLLEAFPTRDKERITAAIRKYSSPATSQYF